MVLQQTLQLRAVNDRLLQGAELRWRRTFSTFEVSDIDGSFTRWAPVAVQVAEADHLQFGQLGNSYLQVLNLPGVAPPLLNRARFLVSLHVTTVAAMKRAVGRGDAPTLALALARSLSFGAVARYLLDAQRSVIMGSAIASRDVPGWRRIGSGGCDFCSMLISRGAVYSRETVSFASHDRCRCLAEPALDDSLPQILPDPSPV